MVFTADDDRSLERNSIWPLFLTPILALLYYALLRADFSQSIVFVVKDATDINLNDATAAHWGSHWFYRLFAEVISIIVGTFSASAIAKGRTHIAGIIGGVAISCYYFLSFAFLLFAKMYLDPESYSLKEPLAQYIVDGVVLFAAPIIGWSVSQVAQELHREGTIGAAGLNRWHFLWFWLPLYFYALGLIAPVIHFLMRGESGGVIIGTLQAIALLIPIFAFSAPLYAALQLFSQRGLKNWNPYARNFLGLLILGIGWFFGVAVQYFWAKLISAITG